MAIPSWLERAHDLVIPPQAISLANDESYALYDSRASAYEKNNRLKDALRDAKKTIDIAPQQWHGYFRSARLFAALGQTGAASRMCSLALERLGDASKHEARRRELMILRRHLDQKTRCPVSGMPVELLLTIFQLSNNPVVVSHVCRRWREVALSQSTLWHCLELAAPAKKAILKAQVWHKRSRGRIVELNIRNSLANDIFPSTRPLPINPDSHALYNELLVALRHLDLTELKESHTEGVNVELFLFDLGGGMIFQHMEVLSAYRDNEHSSNVSLGCHSELTRHMWENLHTLNTTNVWCHWKLLSTYMHHLTSLEFKTDIDRFDDLFPSCFHQFLQANPGLERLVIDSSSTHREEVTGSLTLVRLRHLELSRGFPFHVKSGNFSLPSLRILRMTRLKIAASLLSELVKDEETSFAELVELTARSCTLGPRVLTSVLLRAPKLETLNCTGDAIKDVAESLTTRPNTALPWDSDAKHVVAINLPVLCPALSVLDLSQSADLKTGPVMRIVKERIALVASQDGGKYQLPGHDGDLEVSCIRALKVDECPHIEAEILPWFRKNVPQFSCRYELRRKR